LRIAHLAPGLEVGGLERLLVELARHTDRQRFDLRFVLLGGQGTLAADIEACGWPVDALHQPGGFRPALCFRLARLLRRWGIDVVHTHDDRPHIYGAIAGWLAGVSRVIHTRHRGLDLAVTGRQALLLRLAASLTDRFVCVSFDSSRLAVREGIRRVCVIWNGIDTSRFVTSQSLPLGPIVTVCRLSREKDVATLLRAVALIAPQAPALRLEVAGDGVCLDELRQLARELHLEERVHFLGQVREVPQLLARSGVFVLPSRTEGLSLTILEAMASGLPVLATRVGGNPEVVEDGVTGLLVPPGDPEALAAALLRLWNDPDLRQQMGQAGRQRVEQHFDVRRMTAEYECLYEGKPPWKRFPPTRGQSGDPHPG